MQGYLDLVYIIYAWDLIKALVAIVATGVNEAITKPSMKNNSP